MANIRVTQSTISAGMLAGLQKNLSRLQTIQEQLSSGRQISRPSDSPSGTLDAMRYRSGISRNEQYGRNVDDGIGWLGTADRSLTSSLDLVRRARDLVLSAGDGTGDQSSREAMAAEVDALRGSLLEVANASYLDRPIFAGNANVSAAYDATGVYQGDAGAVMRSVGPGSSVQVNVTGPSVFGAPGAGQQGVLDLLASISTHLRAGQVDTVLSTDLVNLDASRIQLQDKLSQVGARYNHLEASRTRAEDTSLTLTTSLSTVESIDLPKAMVDLSLQQTAYQAALAATARAIQPSLVEFLR
jgi:flagellar hook-associated protein 3 FlgL